MNVLIHATHDVTHFGHTIDFVSPDAEEIDLRDLAWHLSGICADPAARFPDSFGGVYSLAQRHIIAAEALAKDEGCMAALYGFLDGACVAFTQHLNGSSYSGDMHVTKIWARLDAAIFQAFAIPYPLPEGMRTIIDTMSLRVRVTELRVLREHADDEVTAIERAGLHPLRQSIVQWPRDKTYDKYIDTFVRLAIGAGLPTTKAWSQVPLPAARTGRTGREASRI
jgi:hypothetical protein